VGARLQVVTWQFPKRTPTHHPRPTRSGFGLLRRREEAFVLPCSAQNIATFDLTVDGAMTQCAPPRRAPLPPRRLDNERGRQASCCPRSRVFADAERRPRIRPPAHADVAPVHRLTVTTHSEAAAKGLLSMSTALSGGTFSARWPSRQTPFQPFWGRWGGRENTCRLAAAARLGCATPLFSPRLGSSHTNVP
jgi:hypothetical protein